MNRIWSAGWRRGGLSVRVDAVIALGLFIAAAVWGLAYWKRATAHSQPFFYQLYFEPAVMVACGKGFVVARPQVPAMVAFLRQQTDSFSCDAITPDTQFNTKEVFQRGPWLYLMLSVGWTWRLFGVSWHTLGPLFAVMFGTTIAAAYLIFRLGVGPFPATLGAAGLAVSRIHLRLLPSLRDYSKAPMTLVLFVLLGALVLGRFTWKRALTIAALYGLTLGIGYGFRSDFLADIPPFFIALAFFVPGGALKNVSIKASAAVVCLASFLIAGWPALSTLADSEPGCQWHVVILGLAHQFDRPLGVEAAPYEVGREYLDEWAYTTVTSYASRVRPGIGHIEYCEVLYGDATRAYLLDVVKRFPADLIARAYGSVLRVVELPFLPIEGLDDDFDRVLDWDRGRGVGLALVAAATTLILAADLRVGLFVVFLVLYFGGLPAVQFGERHFFQFEFITWFAALFLVQSAITDVRPLWHDVGWRRAVAALARGACVLTAVALLLVLVLRVARAYQQPIARSMLAAYLAAPKDQIPLPQVFSDDQRVRTAPKTDPETADFIIVDVNASACGAHPTVAFSYNDPRRPYGRLFAVDRQTGPGLTHILMPIYGGFRRLEFGDAPPGCVDGVYRVRDVSRFSMLLEAMLPPDWRRQPLYQRLDH